MHVLNNVNFVTDRDESWRNRRRSHVSFVNKRRPTSTDTWGVTTQAVWVRSFSTDLVLSITNDYYSKIRNHDIICYKQCSLNTFTSWRKNFSGPLKRKNFFFLANKITLLPWISNILLMLYIVNKGFIQHWVLVLDKHFSLSVSVHIYLWNICR